MPASQNVVGSHFVWEVESPSSRWNLRVECVEDEDSMVTYLQDRLAA